MPRPRKTEDQRRAERFRESYRTGKARIGFLEPQIAAALGIGESTMRKYKQNPCDQFSINQFAKLGELLGWSDDELLSIIRAENKRR